MQIRDNYKTAIFCSVFPLCLGFMLKRAGIQPDWYDGAAYALYACAVLSILIPKFGIFVHKKAAEAGAFLGNTAAKIILFFEKGH